MNNALRFIMTYEGEFWWTNRHHRTHLLKVWQDAFFTLLHVAVNQPSSGA